jgi:hypothetical protein
LNVQDLVSGKGTGGSVKRRYMRKYLVEVQERIAD